MPIGYWDNWWRGWPQATTDGISLYKETAPRKAITSYSEVIDKLNQILIALERLERRIDEARKVQEQS